jgi:hypothetical protein
MPDLTALASACRTLSEDVETLTDKMAENNDRLAAQERQSERTRKLATHTAVFVAVLVLVSGLLGLVTFRQVVTEDRLDQVVAAQYDARAKGQCPLLALFIASYNPERRQPGTSREEYENAFEVIRGSYRDLHCEDTPGGKATSPPTTPPSPN